jgi:chaperone BCS1
MQYKLNVESENKLCEMILEYVYKNYEKLNMKQVGDNKFKNVVANYAQRHKNITYQMFFGTYNLTFKNTIMIFEYNKEGNFKGCSHEIRYYSRIIISCNCEDILKEFVKVVAEDRDVNLNDNLNIYVPETHGEWIKYQEIPNRSLASIYIDEKDKSKILNDIKSFTEAEDEYNKFGIPYKRCYLFSGIPGSGKTSFIKAICREIGYNLSILAVSKKFDNEGLMWSMSSITERSILLLEDIDCLFQKRDVTGDNPSLTFSNFLNILDGVLYKHGCIIFLTTNHPEKLDHALLRIGRIDQVLEFSYPKKKEIKRLFCDINNDESDESFNKFYDTIKNKNIPMSAIVNFLFINRNNWQNNIDDLLNSDKFINKVLGNKEEKYLYT